MMQDCFANYLPLDNDALSLLPADKVFAPENFGDGSINSNNLPLMRLREKLSAIWPIRF